jgi:hypothetical protein
VVYLVHTLLVSFKIIGGAEAFASSLASWDITQKHFLMFDLVLADGHISAYSVDN